MIRLNHVSKCYPNSSTNAVDNVSFEVQPGEILALVGTSGCGKTTTLKMINRLTEPTSGEIELGGENILHHNPTELRRRIGYVFQETGLFPHLTISENISISLRLTNQPKKNRIHRARELLELVHLQPDEYQHRYPHQLSGGQQQRVGVARALASNPDYLLMDEPFGALDTITRVSLQDEFLAIQQQMKKAVVFVTHDLFEAFKLANQVAVMHQGKIEQIGSPLNIVNNPATDYIKNLISVFKSNLNWMNQSPKNNEANHG